MPELTLFAHGAAPGAAESVEHPALWDRLDVAEGQQSVPGYLAEHLLEIRAELLAWVYDLGRATVCGAEIREHLCCGDRLSMWWCSLLFEKHPKVTPALYPALKLRALERMVEEGGYDALCLRGGDAPLNEALEAFCFASGRAFRHMPEKTSSQEQGGFKAALRDVYYALPGPCKAVLRFGAWLWQVKRLLPRTSDACPPGEFGTIATYFPNIDAKAAAEGRFRSRYWESLHDALRESGTPAVHWLFILFPSPQYSLKECLKLRDAFRESGRDTYHYLEEFLDSAAVLRAWTRYTRLARVSRRLEPHVRPLFHFEGSRMPLWPYLGQYWKDSFQGWRALERCLHREAMLAWTDWAGPQRWTIFPMENCPWERMLTEAVHAAAHGPVYGTQHSTVRPTDFRYFDDQRAFVAPDGDCFQPDGIYGNGWGACAEMLQAGTPQERLGMLEALRYMYLAGQKKHGAAPRCGTAQNLLVVTSFFADEVEEHIRVLSQWMQQTPEAGGWTVRIKPHPYLAVEPYLERYFPQGGAPQIVIGPIGELLATVDVVWASNSTTVALEAALLGLPVLVQLPADDVDLCPLQGVPGVARIARAMDVSPALNRQERAHLEPEYLALNPALPRWRTLLGLRHSE